MPSRSSRSRSRSPSRRHKKKHKRSRKSSDGGSPSSSKTTRTVKKGNLSNGKESTAEAKPLLPSVTLPPSILAKIEAKDEDIVKAPPAEQSPDEAASTNAPATKKRKRRWNGDETEKVYLPNMPTTISAATMTEQQQKIYLCKLSMRASSNQELTIILSLCSVQVQVEELTRRLKVNDLGIAPNPHDRYYSFEIRLIFLFRTTFHLLFRLSVAFT